MAQSLAERYREHRVIFEAALEMGVTPNEARARLRWEQTERKLTGRQHADPRAPSVSAPAPEPVLPWYRQGDMA